jgi:hypothetical protein
MYHHWCTNTMRQDVMTIKSCTLAPSILGSSVWNFVWCHPSSAQNFLVAARSLEIFCTPVYLPHCQRPATTRPTTFHSIMQTRGCKCSFRLLMMGGVSPETCWASYKYGIINIDTLLHLVGFFCMNIYIYIYKYTHMFIYLLRPCIVVCPRTLSPAELNKVMAIK